MLMSEQAAARYEAADTAPDDTKTLYLDALTLVERLHRRLLDVIKDEFDRMGRSDVNSVQALLLFNIGDSELTAGELRTRGYYLGSNVSYNLKKLVDAGFIRHQRSRVDRRSVRVSLTERGLEVAQVVNELYNRHIQSIEKVGGITRGGLSPDEQGAAAAGALLDRPDPLPPLSLRLFRHFRPAPHKRRGPCFQGDRGACDIDWPVKLGRSGARCRSEPCGRRVRTSARMGVRAGVAAARRYA